MLGEDIFELTPGWSFSEGDEQAESKIHALREKTLQELSPDFFPKGFLTKMSQIQQTKLYDVLRTIPKGCLHHVHFQCCGDEKFVREDLISDPILYLDKEMKQFQIGTKKEAEQKGWVSMNEARQQFDTEENFVKKVSNIIMMSAEELERDGGDSEKAWQLMQEKIMHGLGFLGVTHIWKKYAIHVFRVMARNGYDRLQFRTLLNKLTEYDEEGNVVKVHDEKKWTEILDEALEEVRKEFPDLTVGFIYQLLKFQQPEQHQQQLIKACEINWDKGVGIDFVQEEDQHGDLAKYDEIVNKVLPKFPHVKMSKVYHCGETQDHRNQNIKTAIEAKSVRLGHAKNILAHPELLSECKGKICIERCPISNVILGYVADPRVATTAMLLGLGIPLTISPDDPGRFGYKDSTMDYYLAFLSSNWTLRHLKLIALHSINFAVCGENEKKKMHEKFNENWQKWVEKINQ